MTYPIEKEIEINKEIIRLTFYSGLTILIGPNGSGKTRVLKKLKKCSFDDIDVSQIRYLSSNRIGDLEQYRSKINQYNYENSDYNLGDKATGRVKHQIEIAKGDFFVMADRKDVFIKVSERLSVLFNRNMFIRWDSGQLKVFFSKKDSDEEYSVKLEASGLLNLVSILAALYDDEIKVLLIDEPEVSLHPQLQRFVLNEIKKVAGDYSEQGKKLIVMSTHSTEMIAINKVNDLPNYVFFLDDGSVPKQIEPSDDVLKNKKLKELIIRMSQSYKSAFFSKRPLLVEGISDLILCNYFDNKYELNLGVAGTQIVPVEGKGQFPVTVKFMELIGKKPIILTDLDSFVDDNEVINLFVNGGIAKLCAIEKGHRDLQQFVRDLKNDLYQLCRENEERLKNIYENHPYWKDNEQTDNEKKLRRSLTAMLFYNDDAKILQWENGEDWVNIKKRLIVLFEILEQCGCFILRKGALESYYMHTKDYIFDGKPSSAIEEIEFLDNEKDETIEENYEIILRCLNYSSNTQKIDEARPIKTELLAEIAPILGQYCQDMMEKDISSIIKQVRGSEKSIFIYNNEYPNIEVNIESKILKVKGFPIKFKKGDNVNEIVEQKIKNDI